jgi:Icc-related predicted phosphoesterase
MKIALISDLHGQKYTLDYLRKIIDKEHPDGIVISGDITENEDTLFFDKLEKIIEKAGIEGYIIWGNNDTGRARDRIAHSKYCIHLKAKKINGYTIFGLSETQEPIDISSKISGVILVTHRPPTKSLLLKKYHRAPAVHISGHLHDFQIAKQYPATFHISVPTLQNGSYAMLCPQDKKVIFSKITQ